jgi:hypothetical protein
VGRCSSGTVELPTWRCAAHCSVRSLLSSDSLSLGQLEPKVCKQKTTSEIRNTNFALRKEPDM